MRMRMRMAKSMQRDVPFVLAQHNTHTHICDDQFIRNLIFFRMLYFCTSTSTNRRSRAAPRRDGRDASERERALFIFYMPAYACMCTAVTVLFSVSALVFPKSFEFRWGLPLFFIASDFRRS